MSKGSHVRSRRRKKKKIPKKDAKVVSLLLMTESFSDCGLQILRRGMW
jgi:hypothetical protein